MMKTFPPSFQSMMFLLSPLRISRNLNGKGWVRLFLMVRLAFFGDSFLGDFVFVVDFVGLDGLAAPFFVAFAGAMVMDRNGDNDGDGEFDG